MARKKQHEWLVADEDHADCYIVEAATEEEALDKVFNGATFQGGERLAVVRLDACAVYEVEFQLGFERQN